MELNKIEGLWFNGQSFLERVVQFPVTPDDWGYETELFNIGDDFFWVEVLRRNAKYDNSEEFKLYKYMIEFGYDGQAQEVYFTNSLDGVAEIFKIMEPIVDIARRNENWSQKAEEEFDRKKMLKAVEKIAYEISVLPIG